MTTALAVGGTTIHQTGQIMSLDLIVCNHALLLDLFLLDNHVIRGHGNPHKRRAMFGGYLFKYCCIKYQTFHQVCEKCIPVIRLTPKRYLKSFLMPPRAIKHQLTCPFELTSGSFLIGRRRILVIPRNHLEQRKSGE